MGETLENGEGGGSMGGGSMGGGTDQHRGGEGGDDGCLGTLWHPWGGGGPALPPPPPPRGGSFWAPAQVPPFPCVGKGRKGHSATPNRGGGEGDGEGGGAVVFLWGRGPNWGGLEPNLGFMIPFWGI